MEIVIVESPEQAGALVADAISELVTRTPTMVLGLATGSSASPVYRALGSRSASFARARAFLLDEYIGLPPGHPQSYRAVINREVESLLDFGNDAVQGPDVHADDLLAACDAYETAIADAGGIDLQLLGIGTDGHIGFNEPTSSLGSRTRIKTLTDQTRRDNARFFDSLAEVPRHVVTQGIGTILEARHLVMLAFGAAKAEAVAAAVEGPITARVPATALQLHPRATIVIDEEAAIRLQLAQYYRETWSGKPPWQGI
ncbi:MAG: glucosamine-6-phosphate deaminase [Ilumatobacteraceae bacterium]